MSICGGPEVKTSLTVWTLKTVVPPLKESGNDKNVRS